MYNLHCHSLLSDGALLPSEIARRFEAQGFRVIAITDHADYSNLDFLANSIINFTRRWPKDSKITVLPGVELTHIPPQQFKPLVKLARKKGFKIIIGHGESPVEPVSEGTNRAALEAGVDILAHPGLICDEDIRLAAKKKIFLELTSRRGHSNTNSYVAERALKFGAPLIINMDSHEPKDIISPQELLIVGSDAGLHRQEIDKIYLGVKNFLKKKGVRL